MALRKTHIVVSELVITVGIYFWQPKIPIEIIGLMGGWFGAQLPDVDLANTKANHWFGPVGKLFSALVQHRTWTHSIWAVLIMLTLSLIIPVSDYFNSSTGNINYERWLFEAISLGYFLHLLEDSFSTHGVNWFYPIKRSRFRHHHVGYKTGGTFEQFLYILAWIGLLIMLFNLFKTNYLMGG